jgi:HEAT repeat protein
LLKDPTIDYKVGWALGQTADKSAITPLLDALNSAKADVRVIAIQSLEQLRATEALPQLRNLLDDEDRSSFGTGISVAEAARRAISTLSTGR